MTTDEKCMCDQNNFIYKSVQRTHRNQFNFMFMLQLLFKMVSCLQAAIIFVYVYGLITLMARNFDGVEQNTFIEGVVTYVPAMPSLQVGINCI